MVYDFKFRPLVFSGLFVEQKFQKSVDYVRFFLLFSIFGKCYETFTDHQWLIFSASYENLGHFIDHS